MVSNAIKVGREEDENVANVTHDSCKQPREKIYPNKVRQMSFCVTFFQDKNYLTRQISQTRKKTWD